MITRKLLKTCSALGVAALCIACVDTGGHEITVPLRVSGKSIEMFQGRDDWQLTLTRASLVVGPLTLCAGTQAGELCETARAEWLDSAVVDALEPRSKPAGELIGSAGIVRSWMYDHGYVSLLTQTAPEELDAAEKLGGRSLDLRFDAIKGEQALSVVLQMALARSTETEQGVPLVHGSFGPAGAQRLHDGLTLELQFDASRWLESVDLESLAADCAPGCETPLHPGSDSQVYRAVKNQLLAGQGPDFIWRGE